MWLTEDYAAWHQSFEKNIIHWSSGNYGNTIFQELAWLEYIFALSSNYSAWAHSYYIPKRM